jgi:hypothetical protein
VKKITSEIFRTPAAIFIIYIAASCLAVLVFRLIFPGEPPPLPYFSRNWRLLLGFLDILALFPSLALSALVIPFGLIPYSGELYGRFSPKFFNQFQGPIITAICASVMYALVFFLAMPLAQDHKEDLRFRASLYYLAKEDAMVHRAEGDWLEALQFIEIAESIWPQSPELAKLKVDVAVEVDHLRFGELIAAGGRHPEPADDERREARLSALPGRNNPLNAAQAIAMGEEAFSGGDYFDAHWYATVGARLAKDNSIDEANANRLAARAWDLINTLEPDSREKERQALFRLKQSGYQAMVSGDFIRAFYIFQELLEKTPNDPDALNYYMASERGTAEIAFFMDEMELSLGDNLSGALFSLPVREPLKGRAVLRFSYLSVAPDYAFGTGLEYIRFDSQAQPYIRVQAPYAKLLPVTLDDQHKVLILMKALDRRDGNRQWDAQWIYAADSAMQPQDSDRQSEDAARQNAGILLDLSYEDFLALFHMRQGLPNLSITELFELKAIDSAGYIPQAVDAEILGRLGIVLLFLPLTIAALVIGWRYRSKTHPRYLFIPMLILLPLVFTGVTHLYQYVINNAALLLILTVGFTWSLVILIASTALLLFLFLMLLASQKE